MDVHNSRKQKTDLARNTGLFNHLHSTQFDQLLSTFEYVAFEANHVIFEEEELGNYCYIIVTGEVKVYTQVDDQVIVLAKLGPGNYFGEQALLAANTGKRNASVIATTALKCWRISHQNFLTAIFEDPKIVKKLSEIGREQLLKKLEKQTRQHYDVLSEFYQDAVHQAEKFPKNTFFFKKDQMADYVYWLLDGEVLITLTDAEVILHPGQIFGELAALYGAQRLGTAKALTEVRVLRIEVETFKKTYDQHPRLKSLLGRLEHVYQYSNRGLVTQSAGQFQGLPAINTIYNLDQHHMVNAITVIDQSIFLMTSQSSATKQLVFSKGERTLRKLGIVNNVIVSVENYGEWAGLNLIAQAILNQTVFRGEQFKVFSEVGEILHFEKDPYKAVSPLVCECMQVTQKTLQQCIHQGIQTLESISNKTGACTVCLSCKPKIQELLGESPWMSVYIDAAIPQNSAVSVYRLKPFNVALNSFLSGQHIVLKVPIHGHFIQRSYTLTGKQADLEYYEVVIKHEKKGLLSQWLKRRPASKRVIQISQPQGDFQLIEAQNRPIIFFAGGIGVTPAIAFIRHIAAQQKPRFYLDYSAHTQKDFILREELSSYADRCSHIDIHWRVTGKRRHLGKDELEKIMQQWPDAIVYFCGPDSYRMSLEQALVELNYDMKDFHVEIFDHTGGSLEQPISFNYYT